MCEESQQPEEIEEDNPFVYCGFKPTSIMVKRIDTPKKAPVSCNNEVLRFQAMGIAPGTGAGRDSWREITDVIYPLTALFIHDKDYKLECIAAHGKNIWRLLDDKGAIAVQRTDLASDEFLVAKGWASREIDRLQKVKAYLDSLKDEDDEDLDDHGFLGKTRRGYSHQQWDPKLIEKYTKCPLKRKIAVTDLNKIENRVTASMARKQAEGRMYRHGMPTNTCTVDPAKTDDAVDALKYGTRFHEHVLRLAEGYGMGKKGLKQMEQAKSLVEAYRVGDSKSDVKLTRCGKAWPK